ncbi:MAG: hypothetical protein ABJN34_11130 [Litoreibacter sp.]|uniref:hypothetical protein n=1 Tax=Litoreibacter sp. TaxID=1969459 RepID=UPI00329A4D70
MKAVRRPLFWYKLSMWLMSFVIAGLLIQLGGKIMSDVPTAGKRISHVEFVETDKLDAVEVKIAGLETQQRVNEDAIEDARFRVDSFALDYKVQRDSFERWLRTRTAIGSSDQDPEVIKRVEAIERIKLEERTAAREIQELERTSQELRDQLSELHGERAQIHNDADAPYEAARKFEVLKVFLLRLALTLPLLLISAWMIAKKWRSTYWPIYRSFILFSLFAFFVELVPYLPSYGGYVRYIVGITMALIFAHFTIKKMTAYLKNKKSEEQRPETEKRKLIEYETAVKKISSGVCPSCDRGFGAKKKRAKGAAEDAPQVDYCVHCGFCLFSECTNCGTRENSFYKFCGTCGVPSQSNTAPEGA